MARQQPREQKKEPIPGTLGAVVRQLRDARGWTQEELAEAAGLKQNDVSRVETGKVLWPQEPTVIALAEALGVAPGLLYERSKFPEVQYQVPELRQEAKRATVAQQKAAARFIAFLREDPSPDFTAALERSIARLREEFATLPRSDLAHNGSLELS